MKVFKFGGASVRNADAVRNVAKILELYSGEKLMVVISAMGKMTNLLEEIHTARFHKMDYSTPLNKLIEFHQTISDDLFEKNQPAREILTQRISELKSVLKSTCSDQYDLEYDKVVSYGEIISTAIVCEYLQSIGVLAKWVDAREMIKTDNSHRNARVHWQKCEEKSDYIKSLFGEFDIIVIQGFIGSSSQGDTTTLGREGSDFTASIMAYLLNAESVTIWKDVPGMLNADPKWFKDTVKLDRISFREAIELAYYGASVIHPKTIKPLQNKGIPLYIKSFIEPLQEGTIIQENEKYDGVVPSYIFKGNQVLVSVSPKDFSFVAEDNLKEIFDILSKLGIHINLMENSAISFSFCFDKDDYKMSKLFERMSPDFLLKYNEEMTLITIRHYDENTIRKLSEGKEIILEQRSRNTLRMIVR